MSRNARPWGWVMVAGVVGVLAMGRAVEAGAQTKVVAGDGAASAQFGRTVFISGNTALLGATQDDAPATDSGSAYIFANTSGNTWVQQAKLTASDAAASDEFGTSVSLSGNLALIGAELDDAGATDSGSAYVFANTSGSTWVQQAKLTASDGAATDYFGQAVSLSGNLAIVGSHLADAPASDSGAAYIFANTSGSTWTQQAKLTAFDAATLDYFGISVSISGNMAAIGAFRDDAPATDSGSVYIFANTSGSTWVYQTKLTASDAAASDEFGIYVSLSGNLVLVGAHYDDDGGSNSGSAYIFANTSGNTWVQQAKLTASDAAAGDEFGVSVLLSGNHAIVGANQDDDGGTNTGSAYLFTNTSGNTWVQQSKINAADAATGAGYGASFGFSVSLSGNTAVVGATYSDAPATDSGSAYVFDLASPASSGNLVIATAGADFQAGGNTTLTIHVPDLLGRYPASSDNTTQITFSPTLSGNIIGIVSGNGDGGYGVTGGAETVTVAGGVATVRLSDLVADFVHRLKVDGEGDRRGLPWARPRPGLNGAGSGAVDPCWRRR